MKGTACYSNESDEWETPQKFFDELNEEFHFTYDPCATEENHKCFLWTGKKDNGLTTDWGGQRVWCNPPYSQIGKWVEKCFRETRKDDTVVVLLIPARTDTKYFWNYIWNRAEVRYLKGRIKFGGAGNAPFPSLLVIFRGANIKEN